MPFIIPLIDPSVQPKKRKLYPMLSLELEELHVRLWPILTLLNCTILRKTLGKTPQLACQAKGLCRAFAGACMLVHMQLPGSGSAVPAWHVPM